ncbi:MAG TPA: hypothetical protein VMG63_19805 [Terriglobia bacterium]|nr:hypothetical protein [Terriglobia bacterium]
MRGDLEVRNRDPEDKGPDALRRALEKQDVGRINPVGRTGNQIAVARKRQEGSETVITLVTARNMPFIELYRGGRTTDYRFGFLQVKLNEKGEGVGQIMAAEKIRFNGKKGHSEIESSGNQYIKAVNVVLGNRRLPLGPTCEATMIRKQTSVLRPRLVLRGFQPGERGMASCAAC